MISEICNPENSIGKFGSDVLVRLHLADSQTSRANQVDKSLHVAIL